MPTVPWIRLYHNWPRHRKTMALRNALGTAEPILCLWLWAAENAPDGRLGVMSHDDLESAAEWRGERGKAAFALVASGFVDVGEDGAMGLHNWESRTGAGVASLVKTRERQRSLMRSKRANVSANKLETLSLSPDLKDSDPDKSKRESVSANQSANVSANKVRPRTAHELETCLRVAIQREQGTIWNPGGSFAAKEGREFLEGFGDQLEEALEAIESGIELFAKDASMSPWTVAKFSREFNGLGKPKPSRFDGKSGRAQPSSMTVEEILAMDEENRRDKKRR
jgi:hypothetical protein